MNCVRAAAAIGLFLGIGMARSATVGDTVILDGVVQSVDWSGNHLKVVFHSNSDYAGADWTLQGPAPAYLKAMGWTQEALKVGSHVDAVIHPDENRASGQLLRFLLPDYRTLETSPYGSSLPYPPGSIKKTIANVADDPLASTYANTLSCTASAFKPAEANYSCRVWINADHTIRIVRKKNFEGLNPDGSFNLATDTGFWWLENQLGKTVFCTLIDNAPMPNCDSTVERHAIGSKWSVKMHGTKADWTQDWELEAGRRL